MDGLGKVFEDLFFFGIHGDLMLTDVVSDRRHAQAWYIPIKQVPIHEQAHPLLKFGIIIMDSAVLIKEFLLGLECFRIEFTSCVSVHQKIEFGLKTFRHELKLREKTPICKKRCLLVLQSNVNHFDTLNSLEHLYSI